MELKIECPWCNQHYSVDESLIGQTVECSICKREFTVRPPNEHFPKQEKNSPIISHDRIFEKKAIPPKRPVLIGVIVFSALVIVLIPLCIFYFTKTVPEKEYKNGLKAYDEQHYEEAVAFFQKAADRGHEKAKEELKKTSAEINYKNGKMSFDKHRYEEAVDSFQKAAEFGHPEARLMLGMCYFNGDGIKRDYDEAVKWFRRAAEQNNLQAQFKLGVCYFGGIGVNRREDEALYWLQKAAEQGNLESQIYLGDFYYDKGKTLENFSEALKWYKKASETGIIPDESKVKMMMCMTFQEAYNGDATAQLAVYVAYERELFGIKHDESEAQKWLIKSANSGNPKAQGLLGAKLMKDGDEKEAFKWLNKAGEQEDANAMIVLAQYYTEKARKHSLRDETFSAYFAYQDAQKWINKLQGIEEPLFSENKPSDSQTESDQNHNGIPDEWEKEYNISSVHSSANSDEDSDGFTLIQEYEAKTDPTDPLSHPKYITKIYVDTISAQRFTGLEFVSVNMTKPDKKEWEATFNVVRNNKKRSEFVRINSGTFKNNNVNFSLLDIEVDDKTQEPVAYIQRVGKVERIPCRPKQPVYDPMPRVRFINALYDNRTFTSAVGSNFKIGTTKAGEELYNVISADLDTNEVIVESVGDTPETFRLHPQLKKE